MTDTNGVARVISVLLEMSKLNQACDEIVARAQTSILRAAKVISDVSSDFNRLDAAVGALEGLRAASSNNPPVDAALNEAISARDAEISVALAPAPMENPNG